MDAEMSTAFWITPVGPWEDKTPEENIKTLVEREKIYALSEKAHGRRHIKLGDWICFYIPGKGIVAHAKLATTPEKKTHGAISNFKMYPLVFHLKETAIYFDNPVTINADLRGHLDAFKNRDLNKRWSWFVQNTRKISQHDFNLLTMQYV
jgi:hypothetical protein